MSLLMRRRVLPMAAALALSAAVSVLIPSASAAKGTSCSTTFRVLHNDRSGGARLPAGLYRITSSTLTCSAASGDFKLFLSKYNGPIPGWRTTVYATGHAKFQRKSSGQNFTVRRIGK
jgi:hypothetical protein